MISPRLLEIVPINNKNSFTIKYIPQVHGYSTHQNLWDVFMKPPRYSYPRSVFAGLIRDLLLSRKRDFHNDATACIENLQPPLNVLGYQNIPQCGPRVITINHYHRQGFRAEWLTLAVAALVPVQMHWVMTAEFMYEGKWHQSIGAAGSRILLKRIAKVYGFTNMPPMPPREKDIPERAAAVRAVLEYVRHAKDPIIGLAPEGHDPVGPAGTLTRPPSGVGRFGLLLSRAGLRFCPVGAYEADGIFHIHFGESYELKVSTQLSPDERDAQASQVIMEHIAGLLPLHLRGEYI